MACLFVINGGWHFQYELHSAEVDGKWADPICSNNFQPVPVILSTAKQGNASEENADG
jgi:hypothetical protein